MAPRIPASTKTSLQQRLTARARQRWPQLAQVQVRFRCGFAYIETLDTACGLYLGDPTAWTRPRRINGDAH